MRNWDSEVEFKDLSGKTITAISGLETGSEEAIFETSDNKKYRMWHDRECCESSSVNEIIGDKFDIMGSPILLAEEVKNGDGEKLEEYDGSFTWTFYKLSTIKGSITIRWYGTSNGYYSESASFEEMA